MNSFKSESQLQAECFKWSWNKLPITRGLICYNLGNSSNSRQGNMNKALGLIAGRSDMTLYWNGSAHFIEFKQPGQKQSSTQKEWQSMVENNGFAYYIVTTLEQFQQIVTSVVNE